MEVDYEVRTRVKIVLPPIDVPAAYCTSWYRVHYTPDSLTVTRVRLMSVRFLYTRFFEILLRWHRINIILNLIFVSCLECCYTFCPPQAKILILTNLQNNFCITQQYFRDHFPTYMRSCPFSENGSFSLKTGLFKNGPFFRWASPNRYTWNANRVFNFTRPNILIANPPCNLQS